MFLLSLALAHPPQDPFPEMQACLDEGNQTQMTLNRCSHLSEQVHAARETLYAARICWRGDATLFNKAANSWRAFLDARCTFVASSWEGGSGQPMIRSGCRAQTSAQRADHLLALLEDRATPEQTLAVADKALNDTWKRVASGNQPLLTVQRAWLAYRDAQCAWEESMTKGSNNTCLANLTAARVGELEQDAAEP
jgi:uncharacterized protein YecT (DUF1311 family)